MWLEPGQAPRLNTPVPELALVSLEVFLSARLREWLELDGSTVVLDGHTFRIVGWEQDCLLWQHVGSTA